MNWLEYENAQDFLDDTKLSVADALVIVEEALRQLKR